MRARLQKFKTCTILKLAVIVYWIIFLRQRFCKNLVDEGTEEESAETMVKIDALEEFIIPKDSPQLQMKRPFLIGRWDSVIQPTRNLPSNSVEHDKIQTTGPTSTSFRFINEKFTVVILAYRRAEQLLRIVRALSGLPQLSQVLIIWNGAQAPDPKLKWPAVEFSVRVLHAGKNSLNNRFLPLEMIETEAILSLDDDMYFSHESILFAFSVWQENRDRIVGFPGRGVLWNTTRWEYDTNPCAISIVLTGYAFLHRMYYYQYTYEMSEKIRNQVDAKINCEDIAMNFLVSHITKKAPIKVSPETGWECPNCLIDKNSLWKDPLHFEERTECINLFSQIYGYTPLFKSEFRADDVMQSNRACRSRAIKLNYSLYWQFLIPEMPSAHDVAFIILTLAIIIFQLYKCCACPLMTLFYNSSNKNNATIH